MKLTGDGAIERARALVRGARSVTILTGAGISAESGVPTFRGEGGLWRSFRPEELATPGAFRRHPEVVWSWYRWRRRLVARCAPNAGHLALARFARDHHAVTLVTQNVDGLHHRAALDTGGPAHGPVLELHGALFRDRCTDCGILFEVDPAPLAALPVAPDAPDEPLPSCTLCGGLLRPDVVWFGEPLDGTVLDTAFERAVQGEVCIVVGTSGLVHPAASIPLAAREAGRPVIEVNLEVTPLSGGATESLRGRAGDVLPALLEDARDDASPG